MALPLKSFRKHQRWMLVCLAIMAMIAFFVLPPFLQMGAGDGSPRGEAVAATWSGGTVHVGDLQRMLGMNIATNQFLQMAAAAAGRDPRQMPDFAPLDERQILQRMVVVEEAKRNGIDLSDDSVNRFLREWTGDRVRPEQFAQIMSRLRIGDMAVNERDLFDAVRRELIARTQFGLFERSLGSDPPGWRWDSFRRLRQEATVELVAVPVESVADAVALPDEARLKSFFTTYREDFPRARSADPGFRQPRRVRYEYLVAKRESIEKEEQAKVTDEEIAAYYEKNKTTLFRARPAAETPAAAEGAAPTDGSASATPEPAAPAPEAPPAAPPEAAPQPPAEPPSAPVEPASPAPADAPAPAPADVPAPPPESAEAAPRRLRAVAVVFRQESDPSAASAEDKPTTDPAASATAPADAPPPATEPAAVPPATESPAGPPAAGGPAAAPAPETTADTALFEPLDKVRERILETLARQKAGERIDTLFKLIVDDLRSYSEDRALWQAQGGSAAAAPVAPDIDAIASRQGLEAGRSDGPIAAAAAVEAGGPARSFEIVPDPNNRFGRRDIGWLDMTYGPDQTLWRPVTSRDFEGNRYISWKTADEPDYVPEFDTVRPEVERAWRIVEGRGLAKQKAEGLAEKARAAGTPLAEVFAGDAAVTVATAGPFTWLEDTFTGGQPTISQPEGLSMPGEELMSAVHGLEPGQVTIAFNEPRTVCYVIRLVSLTPAEDALREAFVAGRSDQRSIAMVAQERLFRTFDTWVRGLEERYRLSVKLPERR